ncbi:hypothetical protein ACFP1Z_18060 [Streptomyces gamaensis]|uniref:Uncharacterized protein n=1 Tax=Streptomyces gamaensis TaxID=1763542 RepID=A0ABW0Z4R9_9ACTN
MKPITGESRVTVAPLLYDWPDLYCVIAYANLGWGETSVVGTLDLPGVDTPYLLDVAARHRATGMYGQPEDHAYACWVICAGWSARGVPKPGTLDVPSAEWTLHPRKTVELKTTMYGHDRLHVGSFEFVDKAWEEKALSVLEPYRR